MTNLHIYAKHIQFTDINNQTGESPFGNGNIEIHENGDFTCHATGQSGDIKTFFQTLYPQLTEAGINHILTEDALISKEVTYGFNAQLNSFRKDKKLVKVAAEKVGLTVSKIMQMPIFMAKQGFTFYMASHLSSNGTPLTVSGFHPTSILPTRDGLNRPKQIQSERVWVVANPLQALILEDLFDQTVLTWPSEDDLEMVDYERMLEGKEVVLLHGELNFEYSESFYPFLEEIKHSAKSYHKIDTDSLRGGEHLHKWLVIGANRKKLEELIISTPNPPTISPEVYKNNVFTTKKKDMEFSQGQSEGYFFYGLNDGHIVQSFPVDIMSVGELQKKYPVDVVQPERYGDQVKLDRKTVIEIVESIGQLTPNQTFIQIRNLLERYVYFEDSNQSTVIALWIMGTYVYQLFHAFPYLRIQAPKGSGKSTLLEFLAALAFNGQKIDKISPGRLTQEVSDIQASMCMDEFEKGTTYQGMSISQLLNAGYKRGGAYKKLRGDNGKGMNLYSPKAFAGIDDINNGALDSRTIPILMATKPKSATIMGWNDTDDIFVASHPSIKRGLYALGLYDFQKIDYLRSKTPNTIDLPSGIGLSGRNAELVLPILVLAELVDESDIDKDLKAYAKAVEFFEELYHEEHATEVKRLKLFAAEIRSIASKGDTMNILKDREIMYIENASFLNSALLKEFDSKEQMYSWFRSLRSDVIKGSKWINGTNRSCTLFPLDLKVNGKEFWEYFEIKVPA